MSSTNEHGVSTKSRLSCSILICLASKSHSDAVPQCPAPLPPPPGKACTSFIEALALRKLDHLAACYRFGSTQPNALPAAIPQVINAQTFLFCLSSPQENLRVPCNSCCRRVWCSSVPPVIPYRDSTLTKLLYEGLKGNGRVLMMACCSPSKVTRLCHQLSDMPSHC